MALLYLLAFFTVMSAQYILYRVFALRRFRYSCELTRHRVSEGESVELVETVENGGFLPLLWIRIETGFHESLLFVRNDSARVSGGSYHRSVLSAPPFRRIQRRYGIVCSKRGYYRLGASVVTGGDPLGMLNQIREFRSDIELYVYPAPLPWHGLVLPARSWLGDAVVRRFILPDPFMPSGVRSYLPGDPIKDINWKASARTGGLVVHKHDFTADVKFTAFFDVDAETGQSVDSDSRQQQIMEQGIRLLAFVLDASVRNGRQTALRANSASRRDGQEIEVPPGFGRGQREQLLAAMAEMQFLHTRSFSTLLREAAQTEKNADILLMTRFVTNEIQAEVESLRRSGNLVEILLIPDLISDDGWKGGAAG